MDAVVGASQWNRTVFWTLDPPPKADFLPEDEDLIRVPRPPAKPAAHKPPATRRILWLTPEDASNRAETNAPVGTLPARRRRRAVEKTVVSDRGGQDWLGIPGPPSETRGQVSQGVAGETAPTSLRGSKYFPRQEKSDGMSLHKRNERNLRGTVLADASKKWSPTGRGVNSLSHFEVPKTPESQIDPSGTFKLEREDEEKALHKQVQSLEMGLMQRMRTQPSNRLGYPVHDDSESSENRHKKLKTLPTSQSEKRAGNSNIFSRNFKDEDHQLHKKISGQRRLLWFWEGHDEDIRSSFQNREASSWSPTYGPSSSSQSSNMINQYGNTASLANLYRDTGEPSNLRRSSSPGQLTSLDVDPSEVQSGEDHQNLITTLLAKVSDGPQDLMEDIEMKYKTDDLTTSSSWTVNSLDESRLEDSTVLKQEEYAETRGSVSVSVENSTSKEGTVSVDEPTVERSVDGSSVGVQDEYDGLATPNDADLGEGHQKRIGRRLLGVSPNEGARGPAEDVGSDGEMTREEESAMREQVVHDVLGDLLGVDGSGDGSGWGEADT